jgi:hypothetical protein
MVALSPLEQFYLPTYIKTTATASVPIHARYRMLLMTDASHNAWYARDVDVEPGSTPQPTGKPIPLELTESARRRGMVFLYRSVPVAVSGAARETYLRQQVYDGPTLVGMFGFQLVLGGIFFLLQLPWSIPKDIRRWKEMKYGRRLKGPILVLPTPEQLVDWMSHPKEIDRRVKDTELASLIDRSAPQQRSGVLASLSLVADSFRLLPKKEDAAAEWTAREWSKERKGWIFITSQPAEREALRPLHSLWIDMLVLRLLSAPKPEQHPVWFVLDELASLQKLPQLHTAITENRKSRNPIVLGFQERHSWRWFTATWQRSCCRSRLLRSSSRRRSRMLRSGSAVRSERWRSSA